MVTIAATAGLAGCGGVHRGAVRPASEQHYVDGVHEQATDIGQYLNDSKLLRLGRAVCDGFRARASIEQIADLMERTNGRNLPSQDLGAVISTSVKELCPAYSYRIASAPA
jgi:Protein of unknown function (DUF732)